ncbi:MAG: glycosyltransferase family 39 protein [Deltaproteobacteria bacterium]|nr:glycosyltransferase family 39 protein [Deltaproteobacteria bacterium]
MVKRDTIFSIIIITIVAIILFSLFLHKRPFTDEGSYCTIAQAISKGAILYREIFNEKAPLPYFIASVFINVGENPLIILRLLSCMFFTITLILLFLFMKVSLSKCLESLILTIFFAISAPLFQSFNFTAEIIATPLILFITWQIQKDENNRGNILAGFFSGLLFFIKQPFGVFVLIIIIFASISKNIRKDFFVGVLFSLALIILLFKITGVLEPFVENLLFVVKRYDVRSYIRPPYQHEYYQFIILLGLFLLACYGFLRRLISLYEILVVLSLALVGVIRMDAFKMLPFFATSLYLVSKKKLLGAMQKLSLLLLILIFMSISKYGDILIQDFDAIKAVSYMIETKTTEKDSIWVAPHEANIYCLSKRRSSSKYFFLLPWIKDSEVVSTLVDDITRRDPPLCIIDVSLFNKATEHQLVDMIPEFKKIVSDYREIQEINGAVIYCKR